MAKLTSQLQLVVTLVLAVHSQSYPRFVFRGNIGEGHNEALHCVTDNSDCCSNGEGNWYDVR